MLYGSPLEPGTMAPDFTLPDQDGNSVTLSKLRGNSVVLVFYPRDETPTCRAQLCEFRDYRSEGALVFGVNPGDGKSHAAFREKNALPFPLLVDEAGSVSRLYKSKGLLWTVRTVYVIDRDGRIRYARRGKPPVEQVLAAAHA